MESAIGGEEAFRAIYQTLYQSLYCFALRFVNDAVATDVVSKAMKLEKHTDVFRTLENTTDEDFEPGKKFRSPSFNRITPIILLLPI